MVGTESNIEFEFSINSSKSSSKLEVQKALKYFGFGVAIEKVEYY